MITRRQWLQASGVFAAALALGPRSAFAQAARTVKIGVGLKSINSSVINLLIGEALGYNAEEGFTVQGLALGGNANVQVATDKGDVDIGIGVPSYALPILAKGQWGNALWFYQYTYPYKWDVAVAPGSAVKSYADLKGRNIGVSDFGGTEYPVTRNVLKSLGIDPDNDVKWTAVGAGVPAGVALQRGAIDALAYYDTGFGIIEGAGIPFELVQRPGNLPMIGGQFLMGLRQRVQAERGLFVGFGRSAAKASHFILARPAAGAKAFLKLYPETAPRGSSEEQAVKSVLAAISRRIKLYEPPYQGAAMGSIRPDEFTTEAKMNNWAIDDVSKIYTNDLIGEINAFDVEKVREQARSYA
ncbi:ABC transporter substrate-binding protein [Labrys wisconsinensis]|uniref:NitT/TauT family transport system substrate-binding protein n=1 Tax=Labrys wisconsinensis TaxID=425677 RepID=A0ABU0J5P2_9HYPH|nr:ABC transporter substrate-binding protein [Labrys wisconsinensis]MDQ0468886.1 NitT/TauT family transport system substrate-binding protein [Labrys wisconsinensis]